MKTWFVAAAAFILIAAGTYAARWQGIDLVEMSGIRSLPGLSGAPAAKDQAQPQAKAGGNRGASPVEVAKAVSRRLSDDISAIGTLLAEESVTIAPETSGRIAEILFKDGDTVAEGTPLFKLDSDLANAAIAEAQSRLSLAEANFKRNQTLRKSGNIAGSTFDASATELEVARTALESARVNLEKLTVTAPFAGTLGFRLVSTGAYVNAGAELVQLDMVNRLKVSFSVPELQQARIALGQQVDVIVDAVPGHAFTATITGIDPSIDVNGRALKVRAALDNTALKLRPGLLARVMVKGPPRVAVTVPESAVVQRGESAFVYIADDTTAKEAKVTLGQRMPGAIEIVDGVDAGASVIVAGNTRIRNGAAIEIVKSPSLVE